MIQTGPFYSRSPFSLSAIENELVEVLGRERVSTSEIERAAYSRDHIVPFTSELVEGEPEPPLADFVVWPESAGEVSRVLKTANTHRVPVVPETGGAQGSGSTLPVHGGIIMDMKRMNRVIDIDERNHTVTTQTGLIGFELETALNARGFTANHLPQSLHVSGIGGFLSARSAGVLSTKYGKITEMVLGMEVVLPTGGIISTKRVPNSAAGPNLNYLFMGAEGTLGVITEVTLRIHRLPEARRFTAALFPDLPAAVDAARRIMHRGLWPAAMRVNDELETMLTGRQGCQMVLMFDGFEKLADLELKEARRIIKKMKAEDLGEGPARTWWEEKRFTIAFPSSHHPLFGVPKPGHIRMGGCIDSAGTFDYLVKVQRGLKEIVEGMGMILAAHFSHWYPTGGMIYPTFIAEKPKGPEAARAYNEVWRRGVEFSHGLGGTINHHHGIGLNLGRFMHLELGDAGLEGLRSIKRSLDPNNIMNPGKLGL